MFDIGFWELALIGVVALLVVGPDRLPGLARNVGLWVGRIRRYVASVRDDIEREIQAEELRKVLEKSDDLNPLKDIVDETKSTLGAAKQEMAGVEKDAEKMMAEDAIPAAERSSGVAANEDETGAEPIRPADAATAVGEAVSAGSAETDEAASEAEKTAVEDTHNDDRQAR